MTKPEYLTLTKAVHTPLGVIEATGVPEWVDGYLMFEDYRPLVDVHKQWLTGVPAHHRVAIDAAVSQDGFVASTLCGTATYAGPEAEYPGCGDGCCWEPPREEELTLGGYGDVLKVEERTDVVTHLRLEGTLIGPIMATFQLAHPWTDDPSGPWHQAGSVLVRPLDLVTRLDRGGMVNRNWRP